MAEANGAVARNLEHADKTQALDGSVHAATEAHGGPGALEHAEPSFMGVGPGAWVSLAMLAFIIVLLVKKVPALIGASLDHRIADIRKHLDEAQRLRAEAEALRAEYEAKLKAGEADAAEMRARAEEEAAAIVAAAETQAEALVTRRRKMAEDKIAAAERAAVADIRARMVAAATTAATGLIVADHDAAADRKLVDAAIKAL